MMNTRLTYQGSCHCGRVAFELDATLGYVMECNCSLCRRVGALPVKEFDGANWEQAAKAFYAQRK